MPANVEIKARVDDMNGMRRRVEAIADDRAALLEQEDIFFHLPEGRLKLRLHGGRGELIFYRRGSAVEARVSRYRIVPVEEPGPLRALLEAALGRRATVIKERRLYHRGRTRIHLDRVEGLGDFMELEVVLAEDEDQSAGYREARALMDSLRIDASQLVGPAYVDLLEEQRRG